MKYGKEHMTGIGNLMAALATALTLEGRAFLKSRHPRLVFRLAISFVLVFLLIPVSTSPRVAEAAIGTPTSIGTGTAGTPAHTSLTITTTAAVTAGNSIIIVFAMNAGTGTVTCNDTSSNTYTTDVTVANSTSITGAICSAHNVTALATSSTITITHPSAVNSVATAVQVSGMALISAKDQSASAATAANTMSSGATATTEIANELVIGGFTVLQRAITADAPFTTFGTNPAVGTGGSKVTALGEYAIVSSTGAQTATATTTNSATGVAAVVTYRALPAWDSYDNGCASVTNTFDAPPNNVVCAKGAGITTSTTYDLAYYDGAGVKVIEESAVTATGGTLQSGSYTISSCCASSTQGTWHVVAFESGRHAARHLQLYRHP